MPTIEEVTAQALSLPPKSRAILADVLLDSLVDVDIVSHNRLWMDEAKRRDSEISAGRVTCKTHAEVMESATKALSCK